MLTSSADFPESHYFDHKKVPKAIVKFSEAAINFMNISVKS
jgi:hypothetical protein